MINYGIFVTIMFIVTGCASVKHNASTPIIKGVNYPELNKIVKVYIGDQMVKKGKIVQVDVLKVHSYIDGTLYQIPATTFRKLGDDEEYTFFSSTGVTRSGLADPFKALALEKKNNKELCVVTFLNATSCYKGSFEITKKISEQANSFQQTLIYSGRVGNKINVSYREFSNNLARPAFNNDVEYDLNTSSQIGYKGAILEILNADNHSIEYKVVRNFR